MAKQAEFLDESFLLSLYKNCFKDEHLLALVVQHMQDSYLPDRDFQEVNKKLRKYFHEYKKPPLQDVFRQMVSSKKSTLSLLDEIEEHESDYKKDDREGVVAELERYIRQVRFRDAYTKAGEIYNSKGAIEASNHMLEYADWSKEFTLKSSEFVDVISTFRERYDENKERRQSNGEDERPVDRFYIDELDEANNGQELRGQLTAIVASSGVGKSHVARWIGKNACQIDSRVVLHFQLEGSKEECINAYSASLVQCRTFNYETGRLRDSEIERMTKELEKIQGKLYVRSYPKFGTHVSTIDIRNGIHEVRKKYGVNPHIVIIDSMDLLESTNTRRGRDIAERQKRVDVANDLKDLASDENVWIIATYQATIENKEWINDEKNVLSEYNIAEAKGIVRPVTHLITLNQSSREKKEETMRINVAKSRFFKIPDVIRIATNYDEEQFYDRARTMNLQVAMSKAS